MRDPQRNERADPEVEPIVHVHPRPTRSSLTKLRKLAGVLRLKEPAPSKKFLGERE